MLTNNPDRSLHLLVDALGGTVIHEGRDELLGASGPYVHLADAIYHFATPDPGSAGEAVLAARLPADKYYSMVWKVADLDQVASHLDQAGVKIQSRSDDTIVTEPGHELPSSLGFHHQVCSRRPPRLTEPPGQLEGKQFQPAGVRPRSPEVAGRCPHSPAGGSLYRGRRARGELVQVRASARRLNWRMETG